MKIPHPGELYIRKDGETVQVTGILLDDDGVVCVEYKVLGEAVDISDAEMQPLGWFLGTDGAERRFVELTPPRIVESPKTLISALQNDPRIKAWLEEQEAKMEQKVPTVLGENAT